MTIYLNSARPWPVDEASWMIFWRRKIRWNKRRVEGVVKQSLSFFLLFWVTRMVENWMRLKWWYSVTRVPAQIFRLLTSLRNRNCPTRVWLDLGRAGIFFSPVIGVTSFAEVVYSVMTKLNFWWTFLSFFFDFRRVFSPWNLVFCFRAISVTRPATLDYTNLQLVESSTTSWPGTTRTTYRSQVATRLRYSAGRLLTSSPASHRQSRCPLWQSRSATSWRGSLSCAKTPTPPSCRSLRSRWGSRRRTSW